MTDLVGLVERSLAEETTTEFLDRVESQASALADAVATGDLDNEEFTVGMEMEVYAVESSGENDQFQLSRLPETFFECGATKELGLHNAEINTDPHELDADGLATQARSIGNQFQRAREAAQEAGCDLVSDAMWTLAPPEGSDEYLTSHESREGHTIAENMRTDSRYVAIDNDVLAHGHGAIPFDVPGLDRAFPSILFESLATSIQPHLQIPDTDAVPAYFNAGIRTLGPVLALSTNSPFLPPDLYEEITAPQQLVEETHHELRIAVFEQSVNLSPNDKVRVPADIDDASDTITHVLEDDLYAPFLREWLADQPRDGFEDEYWEFDYKRSTHWRWLRCVIGGDAVEGACDKRSVRIEYRPIPTQPTAQDVVGMQVLTVGLMHGLVTAGHPLPSLPWETAERSFYSATREGLDADLAWVTADGQRTTDHDRIFSEVFEYARLGLAEAGLSDSEIDRYLDPIEARWEAETTPSVWKKARVRERLAEGLDLTTAITDMQQEYIERSWESESFADWL